MPGSPARTTNSHSPARAAWSRRWSSAISFSRPMKGAATAGRGSMRLAVKTTDFPKSSSRSLLAVPPQRLGEMPGALRPLLGVLREALQDGGLELLAHVRPEAAHGLRQLVDDAVEDGLHLAGEGRLAREALVEDRPERVDVRAPVEGPRRDLFRAEVHDGPDERPGLREPVLARREREAEVHDARADVCPCRRARS